MLPIFFEIFNININDVIKCFFGGEFPLFANTKGIINMNKIHKFLVS